MMVAQPASFTVVWEPNGADAWLIEAPEVEAVWLPRVGPTSWALMRRLARSVARGPKSGQTTFTCEALAGSLGTSPYRAWASVMRLERFGVLRAIGDCAFSMSTTVPALTQREWGRLPEVVRVEHPLLRPVARAMSAADRAERDG